MVKKNIAIILEAIPVIAAAAFFFLVLTPFLDDVPGISTMIGLSVMLAAFGFVPFIIGRLLCRESKTVRVLGILDLLSTVSIIAFYTLAVFTIGM